MPMISLNPPIASPESTEMEPKIQAKPANQNYDEEKNVKSHISYLTTHQAHLIHSVVHLYTFVVRKYRIK